jgi:predicted amino acid racemase
MFLQKLRKRNPDFISVAIMMHQAGQLPANSHVLDLDAMRDNARLMADEAERLNLKIYAMSKQIGRNPPAFKALAAGGIDSYVAVDMACARPIHNAGYRVGHIGHLVQIPQAEAGAAAEMRPDYWTVFSIEKAKEASRACGKVGHTQPMLARIYARGDTFYTGHEGGFNAAEIVEVANAIDSLPHAEFAGITTFPALLYDPDSNDAGTTPNVETLREAMDSLRAAGRIEIEINSPGTTSSQVMELLASTGATQVEPGHGLTGTTPLHAVRDLPETPAMLYISEIAHIFKDQPYCFGGGLYIDPVFPPYDVKAIVGSDPDLALESSVSVTIPPATNIDYYGILDSDREGSIHVGDSVVFGFRAQAFVTRANIVPISGVSTMEPKVEGIWNSFGQRIQWPSWGKAS